MTMKELQIKLQDSQAEIASLIEETPKTFEEYNDLRMRQDIAQGRFQMLQMLHNNMLMEQNIAESMVANGSSE